MEKHFCLDDGPGFKMIELESIDSTNNFLKSYRPLQPCDMILVTAEYQSRGRGQIGNSWESERSKNLLFSLKVHPRFLEAGQMFRISQVAALAVHDAFARYTEGISIKWPNDVYWNDRKICGMLIENDWMGKQLEQSIIGIGMNVNQETFIGDAPNPVSLRQILGQDTERRFVLELFMESFQKYYRMLQRGEADTVDAQYRKALYRKEGWHLYEDEGGRFRARIADVEPDGHLILEDEQGQQRKYAFKEVRYILNGPQEQELTL